MVGPWVPGVTDLGAVVAAAGPGRRITVSPLKCNVPGGRLKLAGRMFTQPVVNRRYHQERARFRGNTSIRWEAAWQFSDHYLARHLPMTFEVADGLIRSPELPRNRTRRLIALVASRVSKRLAPTHVAVYRLTRGRIGHRLGSARHLLLTTRGRRSGRARTVPVAYVLDGARWAVIATNGGADRDPGWLLNLRNDPDAVVEVDGTRTSVVAREASRSEMSRLVLAGKRWTAVHKYYGELTARAFPVVLLEPRFRPNG